MQSDSEIRFLWKRPKNAGGYLFFIHRYFNFFGNMVAAFALFSTSLTISVRENSLYLMRWKLIFHCSLEVCERVTMT